MRHCKLTVLTALLCSPALPQGQIYFPPPGETMEQQSRWTPEQAGFDPKVISDLTQANVARRWALWRYGRLIHVHGDFNETSDVASNRKTWHAMLVGAAIQQGKIPSVHQKLVRWNPELSGLDAAADWWHVITQSAGFDYPYGEFPDFEPGRMWTYSDLNLIQLCRALARVYGRKDYNDSYDEVARAGYFDAIGMRGWKTVIKKDARFHGPDDGVRFLLDLEDMGRLGLLALARGNWAGRQLVPKSFVEALETKQTRGMRVNYQGPNDGIIGLDPRQFPEVPYGFLTWSNSDGDLLPGAGTAWAYASGAGGHKTYWNRELGIVYAAAGANPLPPGRDVANILESRLRKTTAK